MILLVFKSEPDFRMHTVIWKMSVPVPCVPFTPLGVYTYKCVHVCSASYIQLYTQSIRKWCDRALPFYLWQFQISGPLNKCTEAIGQAPLGFLEKHHSECAIAQLNIIIYAGYLIQQTPRSLCWENQVLERLSKLPKSLAVKELWTRMLTQFWL